MGRSRGVRKRVRRTSSQMAADIAAASAADKKAGARLKAALKIGSSIKQKPPAASAPASVPAASATASLARSIPSRQPGDPPRVGENRWTDPNRVDGIEGVPRGWVAVVHGYEPPGNDELVGTTMGWTIMFRRRREASRAFQWFTARVAPLGGNAQSAAPSPSPASPPPRSTANNADLVFGEAHAHVPTRLTCANFGDGSCLHGFCWFRFRIMQQADYDLVLDAQVTVSTSTSHRNEQPGLSADFGRRPVRFPVGWCSDL